MPAFLLATAVKATVILIAAFAAGLLLRRAAAAARHLVWTAALAAALALPVFSLLLPAWPIAPLRRDVAVLSAAPPVPAAVPAAPAAAARAPVPVHWSPWIWGGWLAGASVVLARLVVGLVRIKRLARAARPMPALAAEAAALAPRIGLRRPILVLEAANLVLPVTWGSRRPVILLPAGAAAWPAGRLRVVLAHEMLHAARHDWLTQWMASFCCALYWFHPLVWMAAGRFRKERELACDDGVLRLGFPGSAYAQHLLELARALRSGRQPWSAALAMAHASHLESRLIAMLNPRLNRRALSWRSVLYTAAAPP